MAAQNRFGGPFSEATMSSGVLFEITPSDSDELEHLTRQIYVGTGGDVVVEDMRGNEVTFKNVPSGTRLDIRATKVVEATTAEDLVGGA